MFAEIKQYFHYLKSDSGGKKQREIVLFILLALMILIPLNHFFLNRIVDDDLFIRFQQAKLFFQNNLSPYNEDTQSMIEYISEQSNWNPNPRVYDIEISPIWLIFYFPFSLLKNLPIATTLFLTVVEFLMIATIYLMFLHLHFEERGKFILLDLVFGCTTLFFLRTFFSGNLAVFTLITLGIFIFSIHNQKFIKAGIILGLMYFEIVNIPALVLICVFGMIKNRQFTTLVWSFISFFIFSLLLMVFDRNWPIAWLKYLFITPQRVPFLTFPQALSMKFDFPPFQLFSIVVLGLVIWLLFETWRNPFNSIKSWFWGLGLGGIINYYLFLQMDDTAAIVLVISLVLIVSIWREKLTRTANMIISFLEALISIILTLIYFLFPGINKDLFFNLFVFNSSILFCLNLYWLRRWAINIFNYEENNFL